jgi:alpha-ketoglutarate-dependent taurine dioxygenase
MHAHHIVVGEKSLFVNPTFTNYIEGFSLEESRYILELLYTHSIAPERVVRWHWWAVVRRGAVH